MLRMNFAERFSGSWVSCHWDRPMWTYATLRVLSKMYRKLLFNNLVLSIVWNIKILWMTFCQEGPQMLCAKFGENRWNRHPPTTFSASVTYVSSLVSFGVRSGSEKCNNLGQKNHHYKNNRALKRHWCSEKKHSLETRPWIRYHKFTVHYIPYILLIAEKVKEESVSGVGLKLCGIERKKACNGPGWKPESH